MPFPVQHLIEGHRDPVVVTPGDTIQRAVELMIENNFSQLPVVDSDYKPVGLITNDSILQALSNFGLTIGDLKVSHAVVRADSYRPDGDLFALLDDLDSSAAVLIVDGEGKLKGIVTSADTTNYFRRRAEDMMLVQDIELALRDHILSAFSSPSGDLDQTGLSEAISEITDANQDLWKAFRKALNHYLQNAGNGDYNEQHAQDVFQRHLARQNSGKSFEDLTFNEYTALLLYKGKSPKVEDKFGLAPDAIRRLLDAVRDTRNDLAHFQGEITPQRRAQLRFCNEWITRYPPAVVRDSPSASDPDAAQKLTAEESGVVPLSGQSVGVAVAGATLDLIAMPVEVSTSDESRYAPLAIYLQQQTGDKLSLTFDEIERIIGGNLPASARVHRAWWANDTTSHAQSQQWLGVGWRVTAIDLVRQIAVFARIKERQFAYIAFFSRLLDDLRREQPFPMRSPSPDGASWMEIAGISGGGRQVGRLVFSFATGGRFRVEFYIDSNSGDEALNQRLFAALQEHKAEIQSHFDRPLNWEELPGRRASRIAIYHEGAITDSDEELAQLRAWGVDQMIRLHAALADRVRDILKTSATG